MKKFFFAAALLLFTIKSSAQYEKCATMHVLKERIKNDPSLSSHLYSIEEGVKPWIAENKNFLRGGETLTIPVVVHVVYEDPAENIPDSQIYSQIDVLNEDYRRFNQDTLDTRDIFKSITTDTGIEFCLASTDPDGNPTTGITRTLTTMDSFDPLFNNDKVKSAATGGKDPWPTDKYLNIWVCDMSLWGNVFVLGYAQFPGDDPATDGVVVQYQHFGRTYDPAAAPANLGRTATHEVGHWLGLRHIWGDGDCDSTDHVDDTPRASEASQSDCDKVKNSCANEDSTWSTTNAPDMVENYMDYSADACMNSFTNGQSLRMWSMINTFRSGLLTSSACASSGTAIASVSKEIKAILFPNPANGIINVAVADESRTTDIKVYNLMGELLWQGTTSEGKASVDLTLLPSGIYFAALTQGSIKPAYTKIVLTD